MAVLQEKTLRDSEVYLGGERVTRLREFNYKVSQEHENIHGLAPTPIAQGSGPINFEGEVKLLYSGYLDLMQRVPVGGYITQLSFDIVDTTFDAGRNKLITTRALGCRIKEADVSRKYDDKFSEVSLPLVIADVQVTMD